LSLETKTMTLAEKEEAERRLSVYEAMVAEVEKGLERKA
jgi:hypothetical protein